MEVSLFIITVDLNTVTSAAKYQIRRCFDVLNARSLPALVEMIQTLVCELHQIGLQLDAAKRSSMNVPSNAFRESMKI